MLYQTGERDNMTDSTFQIKALLSQDDFIHYATDITKHLVNTYPDFPRWFAKVASELPSPDRKAYVALVGEQVAGITIFKKGDENKLCTLYIHDQFHHYGIGSAFMKIIKDYYAGEYCNVTIAEDIFLSCSGFFTKNGFIITQVFNGIDMPERFTGEYIPDKTELQLTCYL